MIETLRAVKFLFVGPAVLLTGLFAHLELSCRGRGCQPREQQPDRQLRYRFHASSLSEMEPDTRV